MDREERRIPHFSLDAILTLIFYLLVLATLVSYFVWGTEEKWIFMSCGISALAVRAISYLIRLIKR